MTSVIGDNGVIEGVTLLLAEPNTITHLKSTDVDGYEAVQLGFEESKKPSKALAGHTKKAGTSAKIMREFRTSTNEGLKVGDKLSVETFEVGDVVDVTGISKGKGFAGTIKRHNFKRGRKTHGGRSYRRPGSIGSMFPQNIKPGKKMAGQMGHKQVTTKRLKVALVDNENAVVGVAGSVPGPRRGVVILKETR
jgi:large subunit ribosomal protein L3